MSGICRAVLRPTVGRDDVDDAMHRAGWRLTNVLPAAESRPGQLIFTSPDGDSVLYLVDDGRLGVVYIAATGAEAASVVAAVAAEVGCEAAADGSALRAEMDGAGLDLAHLARGMAVLALTSEPDSAEAVAAFARGLEHTDARVRAVCLTAVAYAPWAALVEPVARVAGGDPSPPLRAAAQQWSAVLPATSPDAAGRGGGASS